HFNLLPHLMPAIPHHRPRLSYRQFLRRALEREYHPGRPAFPRLAAVPSIRRLGPNPQQLSMLRQPALRRIKDQIHLMHAPAARPHQHPPHLPQPPPPTPPPSSSTSAATPSHPQSAA